MSDGSAEPEPAPAPVDPLPPVTVTPALPPAVALLHEVGHLAVWSVTSAKPGAGVGALRDGRDDTYWQSDGAQPHLVSASFQRAARLAAVALYVDHRLDESYTPQRLSVRLGASWAGLREARAVELAEPQGWVLVPLAADPGAVPRAWALQLAVVGNHQNGRDTHIRQVRVYAPRARALGVAPPRELSYTSPEFAAYAGVR